MIVKIKNSEEGWSYFECSVVHVRHQKLKERTDAGDCVCLLVDKSLSNGESQIKFLNLETDKSHFRKIITDRGVYLLNNQGKTIDRL